MTKVLLTQNEVSGPLKRGRGEMADILGLTTIVMSHGCGPLARHWYPGTRIWDIDNEEWVKAAGFHQTEVNGETMEDLRMALPIRRNLDYAGVARRALVVDPLPTGPKGAMQIPEPQRPQPQAQPKKNIFSRMADWVLK